MPDKLLAWLFRYWRITLAAVIFGAATAAFTQIRPTGEAGPLDLPAAAYRAIGLFVLDAPGFPASGQPGWLVVAWIVYFAAPLVTASALVQIVQRFQIAVTGPAYLASRYKDHYIVCGYGNHGRLLVERILEKDPTARVVVIDREATLPDFLVSKGGRRVPVIRADLTSEPDQILETAGVARAKGVLAVTGEDMVNLNLCLAAYTQANNPGFRSMALVADNDLAAGFQALLDGRSAVLLNTYESAANSLVTKLLGDEPDVGSDLAFEDSYDPDVQDLVIVGFGRFGQMLAKVAVAHWASCRRQAWLTVVDLAPDYKVRRFMSQNPAAADPMRVIKGNIEDPRVIQQILTHQAGHQIEGRKAPIIILCTDNDLTNLRMALALRRQMRDKTPYLLTRMFERPPLHLNNLLWANQIRSVELGSLIAEVIPDWIGAKDDA
jgi:Trk K+ transport system NAD-binding subunit